MKKVLLFGAGKSATVLIEYLLQQAAVEQWQITVVDLSLELAQEKIGSSSFANAVSIDITDAAARGTLIQEADIVLSLMPPHLHFLIAKDCIQYKKSLLTASYVDDALLSLKKDIEQNGILFLCEMGLDPGIDHMSAKQLIDRIESEDGQITSFISHCGGLVAPESDDNPWHYKVSWNPRNVVMAGKSGAIFKQNDTVQQLGYEEVFKEKRFVDIPGFGELCWYPNRNSLSYIDTYQINDCSTFIRTTLRYPDFISGWKNIIDLKLTDEEPVYETNGKTFMQFFKEHMEKHGFSDWLQEKLQDQLNDSKTLLENLMKLVEAEEEALFSGEEKLTDFLVINDEGTLQDVNVDEVKIHLASAVADKMQEANTILKQLFYLGMDDNETLINKGRCSAADVVQLALEKELALQPQDKDMVIMLHELEYLKNNKPYKVKSSMMVKGEDKLHTAMAKTVGLPLGIAAKFILNGSIQLTGLHIPIEKAIYQPVLQELHQYGISFNEQTNPII